EAIHNLPSSLRRVVEDIKLINHSASRNTKSLAYSRAIGELTEIIDHKSEIPEAEKELIVDIAEAWKSSLEKIGKDIGSVTITKPVGNPYIIGNPVTGSLFVGREDILRQLEELWITGNQLQSVVLYGHRRMGKTSILLNVAQATGAETKVIYVNLQRLGEVSQGVGEVLMAISDEIAAGLDIESPEDNDFLQLPQRTFERYLKRVVKTMAYRGLIIALDEFETIEDLIQRGQIDPAFMGYLRGLVQMQPDKIAFAFAGLHTLEEMTADYFKPFFASVIPIPVSFLNSGATKTILANPIDNMTPVSKDQEQNTADNEFLLDYTGEALDLVYSLTAGQPYLVQLIGFQLVRDYNDRLFEQGVSQNNTLTLKDVETIINPKFFQQGRYYFEGVWGQAAQDAPGQQTIITALAPHPQGLTKDKLADETGLEGEVLEQAISILLRHDVIEEQEDNYRIIVELFRRWVIMKVTNENS
ncbi:MAG: ATP-binding protein, partial [Cyanobacteria bacterium J06558_2]